MTSIRSYLKKHWTVIAIVGLAIVLLFEARYFITTIQSYYSQGELRPEYKHREIIENTDHTKTISTTAVPTISSIQLWMTFDYINVVFKLPTNYIKDILGVNDLRYPNVRLDTYAKRSQIDPQLLLQTVKQYITTYKNR